MCTICVCNVYVRANVRALTLLWSDVIDREPEVLRGQGEVGNVEESSGIQMVELKGTEVKEWKERD